MLVALLSHACKTGHVSTAAAYPLPGVLLSLVQNVTLAQLHSLHLGGREGLRAPTLRAFMSAFKAAKARRPLVVEVKRLMTDPAREHLIQLLR